MIDDTQTMEHITETHDTTINETHIEVQEPKPKVRKTRKKKLLSRKSYLCLLKMEL